MVLWQNNIYFELFDKYFDSFAVNFTNSTSGLPVGLVLVFSPRRELMDLPLPLLFMTSFRRGKDFDQLMIVPFSL